MLVLFVVSIVDLEEFVYILVEPFSHIRRAFFCILVLLEQNQVDDLVVVEHRLDSTRVPNVLHFEFFQVLLRRMNVPPRQSCLFQYFAPRSTQFLTKTCGFVRLYAIFQIWIYFLHAWVDELSAAFP